jgi:hypothetical protein
LKILKVSLLKQVGDIEIEILPPGEGEGFYENIAEEMDENTLQSLGYGACSMRFSVTETLGKTGRTAYKEGLTLLGLEVRRAH